MQGQGKKAAVCKTGRVLSRNLVDTFIYFRPPQPSWAPTFAVRTSAKSPEFGLVQTSSSR